MSTLKVNSIQNATGTTAVTLDASGNATFAGTVVSNSSMGMRNRIINGAMVIDQRNNGASVANSAGSVFPVDRFTIYGSQASKFTAQQNAGSVTPPAGFTNYLGITSSSAYSITSTDTFLIRHKIEGYNMSDFAWGTANAKTVTLSFWVRSSLTGTFGGSLTNSAQDRCYPYSYTISTANTWEYKTITISGDTSGTWLTTNGTGIDSFFNLGTGSTYSGTAGAWTSTPYLYSSTGATSVVGTSGATFYITGVQLEIGSTATPFERRLYGTELALCQRYYLKLNSGAQTSYTSFGVGVAYSTTSASMTVNYPVQMRGLPTYNYGGSLRMIGGGAGIAVTASNLGNTSYLSSYLTVTVASGLTTGSAYWFGPNGDSTAYLDFSAEL